MQKQTRVSTNPATPERKYPIIAERFTAAECWLYTMQGTQRAIIKGRLNPYATIVSLDSPVSIEVSWPLVERKMEGDKTFYAC